MLDTLSAQKDRHMHIYDNDLFMELDKRFREVGDYNKDSLTWFSGPSHEY